MGIFGNSTGVTTDRYGLKNVINFGLFQMNNEPGLAESITAKIYCFGVPDAYAKAALYDSSLNLISSSDEVTITSNVAEIWYTFPLSGGYLTPNASYHLAVWAGTNTCQANASSLTGASLFWDSRTYDGWPDPVVKDSTFANKNLLIYCTYGVRQDMIVDGDLNW